MYVCGPTVYDQPHIGNARPGVVFDLLWRFLRHQFPKHDVVYARNYTDVDTKIVNRATELGIAISDLTETTIASYDASMEAINIIKPSLTPRATEYISQMQHIIATLIEREHAYVAEGYVLFDVASKLNHGWLSRQDSNGLKAGARVEIAPYKKSPEDFILWKPVTDGIGWDSPWGFGRPGWHIECTAMVVDNFTLPIDIHGGGGDLMFPHHENENAQAECYAHTEYVRYWMHTGMILSNGKKMSKSLGNFVTVNDALAVAPGEAVRLLLMSTHYRQPLDWSWQKLADAKSTMDRFYRALQHVWDAEESEPHAPSWVVDALLNDLNVPEALAAIHRMANHAMKARNEKEFIRLRRNLIGAGNLLGIMQMTPEEWFRYGNSEISDNEIDKIVAERDEYRLSKNWTKADEIRNRLDSMGIILEDKPDKTIWRRK